MSKYYPLHIKRGPFEYKRIGEIAYASLFGFKFFKKFGNASHLLGVNWVKPYA